MSLLCQKKTQISVYSRLIRQFSTIILRDLSQKVSYQNGKQFGRIVQSSCSFIFNNRGHFPQPSKRVTSQNLQKPLTNSQNTFTILVFDQMSKDQIAAIILIRTLSMFPISSIEISWNPVNDDLISLNKSILI